jgi:uncharacterized protein (DUF2132 family)
MSCRSLLRSGKTIHLNSETMPEPSRQPNNPLHGITLERILTELVERHGWEAMGDRIPIRCFQFDPSIKSSLTFLRKTPWARKRVEDWYVWEHSRRE